MDRTGFVCRAMEKMRSVSTVARWGKPRDSARSTRAKRWQAGVAGVALCSLAVATGCRTQTQPVGSVLVKIGASESAVPLAETLAEEYGYERSSVVFDITRCQDEDCVALVVDGQVHIALASSFTGNAPDGIAPTLVARDAIAVLVHPSNPIGAVTLLELRSLFAGNADRWTQVGGTDSQVEIVTREEDNALARQFESVVLAGTPISPAALVLPSQEAVVDYVARHPGSIGYVSASLSGQNTKTLSVEGVHPDLNTVSSGSYPIALDLFALNRAPAAFEVERFLQFAVSPAGQTIVGRDFGRIQ